MTINHDIFGIWDDYVNSTKPHLSSTTTTAPFSFATTPILSDSFPNLGVTATLENPLTTASLESESSSSAGQTNPGSKQSPPGLLDLLVASCAFWLAAKYLESVLDRAAEADEEKQARRDKENRDRRRGNWR